MTKPAEAVNQPDHYNAGEVECIDGLRAALSADQFRGFCIGNSIKYLWRAGLKDAEDQELQKAIWYARMARGDDPRKDTTE